MFKFNRTEINKEEAQMFWDYVLTGHIAQDNEYYENSIVEKINSMIPDGYEAHEIVITSKLQSDFVEEKQNDE